jgi:hypothetical protein
VPRGGRLLGLPGSTWRMLAARRDLRLLLSAGTISLTGDWVLIIAADHDLQALA